MPTRPPAPRFDCWVLASLAAYVLLQWAYRLWLSPVMAVDDAELALLAQDLRLGYHPDRPPLHNWLTWLFAQVGGPTLLSIVTLKYLQLGLAQACLYGVARRLLVQPESAAAALIGSFLFYHIGFQPLLGFGHTMSLWLVMGALFLLLVVMGERRATWHYLALGALLAAGLLTKPSFLATLAVLPLALWVTPALRPLLKDHRLLLSLLVMAALYAPYFYWQVTETDGLIGTAQRNVAPRIEAADWQAILTARLWGVLAVLQATGEFLLPFVPLWAVIFLPGAPRRGLKAFVTLPAARLIVAYSLLSLAFLLIVALAIGTTNIKQRHMVPYLLFVPIWFFAVLEAYGTPFRFKSLRGRLYAAATAALALAVVYGGWHYLRGPSPGCDPCRWQRPYGELASWVTSQGLDQATLIAGDEFLGANLLALNPGLRVYSVVYEFLSPPPPTARAPLCLVMWEANYSPRREKLLAALVAQVTGDKAPAVVPQAVTFPFTGDPGQQATYYWALLPAKGDCR